MFIINIFVTILFKHYLINNIMDNIIKSQPILNIGCLGCVSDGKSTLINKLTGIKTQKHSQEKIRNITIKQGYGNMKIWQDDKSNYYTTDSNYDNYNDYKLVNHISFIDCPGHSDYVNTMISSTSMMNGVIIVISVDTPLHKKTQLLQHLLITQVNKINKIIICLNKIDLVDKFIVQSRKEELDELLLKYNINPFIIIPTSFNKMIGINHVINSIMTLFNPNDLSNKYNDKPLFRISRSFDINKPGTDWNNVVGGILGGTLIKGNFKINDEIEIRPGIISNNKWNPIKTKIISIKSDNINLDSIISGGLVGIGTLIDSYYCKNDLLSGNIAGLVDNLPNVYTNIDILINIIDTNFNINKNDNIILYIGTNSFNSKIININNNILNLELNKPMCIDNNDNIIICNKLNKIIGYGSLYIKN